MVCNCLLEIRIIGFDHRKSVLQRVPSEDECPEGLRIHVNVEKSSSNAVYEHFSAKLGDVKCSDVSRYLKSFFPPTFVVFNWLF